jgi:transcriptional regulator with XRE-family HTH domain
MTSFGKKLLTFRKHNLKLTRKQFSETFNISSVTLRSWENGNIRISERNSIRLEKKLIELGVPQSDLHWLFREDEPSATNEVIQKDQSSSTQSEEVTTSLTNFTINSYSYEPIFPKNTIISLKKMSLEDIKCPCLGAIKDKEQNLHFGLISETINGKFCMHAYQEKPYTVYIDNLYEVFTISRIKMD